jgi:ribosomal protein S20
VFRSKQPSSKQRSFIKRALAAKSSPAVQELDSAMRASTAQIDADKERIGSNRIKRRFSRLKPKGLDFLGEAFVFELEHPHIAQSSEGHGGAVG